MFDDDEDNAGPIGNDVFGATDVVLPNGQRFIDWTRIEYEAWRDQIEHCKRMSRDNS